MLLPPQSARRSVRLRCAGTLASISYLYSHLTAAWISEEPFTGSEDGDGADPARLPWVLEFRERFLEIAQQLQVLKTQASVAKLEGNVRGKWPAEEYAQLVQIESEMAWALGVVSVFLWLGSLATDGGNQLGGSLSQLDDDTRIGLLKHTVVMNPNFVSIAVSRVLSLP